MSSGNPGRPRKTEAARYVRRIQLGLTKTVWEQIQILAEQEEMTNASYIRMVLRKHVKEKSQ